MQIQSRQFRSLDVVPKLISEHFSAGEKKPIIFGSTRSIIGFAVIKPSIGDGPEIESFLKTDICKPGGDTAVLRSRYMILLNQPVVGALHHCYRIPYIPRLHTAGRRSKISRPKMRRVPGSTGVPVSSAFKHAYTFQNQ